MAEQNDQQRPEGGNKHIAKEFGLTSLSVNNRTSVLILTFIIILFGVQSYVSMPKESFPEVVIPTIYVGTVYPGNSPLDMENLITRPIEKELNTLTGVKDIKSTSIQDYSTIIVEFNPDEDVDVALQDVKDAVDKAKSELPDDLDKDPEVFEINFSEFPVMNVNISGDYSLDELKDFGEYLEEEIEKFSEISKVDVKGTLDREIQIIVDMHKMEARQVSFNNLAGAVGNENLTMSGGNVLAGDFRRTLRIDGEFERPQQLMDVIIKSEQGNIVYLRDVAEVKDTYAERESYARQNQKPVVTLDIIKKSGENLLDAAEKIDRVLQEAKATRFPKDLEISITNDQSEQTQEQLDNLVNSIIFGVILVVLVLTFFLNLRNALFVGAAIPLSMFMAFMLLNAFGVTLNIMVLFGLILALGMLVDNGIVVVENIYRLMQEGYSPMRAAKEGAGEVALPIITSTLTTLAAFVPLAFWQGIIGEFMYYLPVTLIIVLTSSLFVALVINPVLTSMFMKVKNDKRVEKKGKFLIGAAALLLLGVFAHISGIPALGNLLILFAILIPVNIYLLIPTVYWFQNSFLSFLEKLYNATLNFALRGAMPYVFLGGTFLLLVGSIGLLTVSAPKVELFPINDPQYINIFVEKPIGTDIDATNKLAKIIEKDVIELMRPYDFMVEAIIAQVGAGTTDPSEGPSQGVTPHKARITVSFEKYQDRRDPDTGEIVDTKIIMEKIRAAMEKYPGAEITVAKNTAGPPVGKPINIEVSGENYPKLISLATKLLNTLEEANVPGVEQLKTDIETGKPELLIHIDRDKARRFGLSTYSIANELRTALFGLEVSQFKDGEDEYPIQLRLKDSQRYDVEALMNKRVTFRDMFGNLKQIPIASVASVEYSSTYGSVKRIDLDRVISIFSNVKEGYNANEIVAELKGILAEFETPEGYDIKFTGEQEEQQESMAFLGTALLIAVFAIFLIIVSQFNSISTPFIILLSVLFSTIGVFLGLITTGKDFIIIMTGIGIISLAGVVVNNAIVLLDYTSLVRRRHKEALGLEDGERLPKELLLQSIIEGGRTRLRPVLLTAITTVLGLVPLATGANINFYTLFAELDPQFYAGGDNAIFWGPMAWTVIYGLIFATFLTLVIVPVMYLITDKIKYAVGRT